MGNIVVLDDNMINMIAAGEVIERPASVVKELLENSIDSGAKKILVQVEQGGRDLIRVVDDGCGMDAEDLRLAFEAHATSKIRNSDDLLKISTMGFRGEALASIGSVSKVTVISRPANSLEAYALEIDCGEKQPVRPESGAVGTTIEVRNLFYKLPARRKFLRTANTEMTHITEQFTRIALAYPDLDLTLEHNGRQTYRILSDQSIRQRVEILFSPSVAEGLTETARQEKTLKLRAFFGRPDNARTSNKYQYIFLNKRFIRDKFVLHAFREAYRGLTEPNRYPVVFLFLEIPPDSFDVNVHPTKTEVRFENPNWVYSQVLSLLRDKLLSCDFPTAGHLPQAQPIESLTDNPLENLLQKGRTNRIHQAMEDFFETHSKEQTVQKHFTFPSASRSDNSVSSSDFEPSSYTLPELPKTTVLSCIQIHNSYLVLQTENGFEIIDQHALHERIIYEKIKKAINEGTLTSQRLLVPPVIDITDSQADALKEHQELIAKLGIELESFGPKSVAVQSFPALLGKADPEECFRQMLDIIADPQFSVDVERLTHEVLDQTACKAAIKAGQPLTNAEIEQLLADRQGTELSGRCPHGRPTAINFTLKDLEKQFKRTGF